MPRTAVRHLAPLLAALQMLRGRALRSALMTVQFTVGFAALIILAVLVAGSRNVTRSLELTFSTPRVLALYPVNTGSDAPSLSNPVLTDADLPALEALPGVKQAAVLWQFAANLPNASRTGFYAANDSLEGLMTLRVVERFAPDAPNRIAGAGNGWVFLTPAARQQFALADGSLPDSLTFRVAGHPFTARLAGIVEPPAGWPGFTGSFSEFAIDPPALVMDYAAVREWAWLMNAIWLVLDEGADADDVRREVEDWYRTAYPDRSDKLEGLLVADEIARRAAIQQPGSWVAAVLSVLFLLLAGLGFAGHAMLMADTRRSEWALRLALGATHGQVMLQILTEIVLVVLAASILSLGIVTPLVPTLAKSAGFRADTDWLYTALAAVSLAAMGLSALAAAYPLRRIRQEEPSAILKETW